MNGKIFGIKKSFLLLALEIALPFVFVAMILIDILVFKIPDLWFFSFSSCVGAYELVKSVFFHLDSSLYFGTLLSLIGGSGYAFWLSNTENFATVWILSAVALASITTYIFTGQRFHLIFSYSIIFADIFSLILIKNLINWVIFVAFLAGFLLLLISEAIIFIKWRK